ncbi:hypothetical protein FA95DRAFT_228454 [Auriscalpium vulgare]|uniref:Uncharacterized protein n=1 Tax=Auriscalpium vulgare TaxID=40419 RepID=A0ACB8RL57_9AGAM|nr:hypothetical protein FA95DRAFT_228454 [Auriscalpium vulgare]
MPAVPLDVQLMVITLVYRESQHSTVDYQTLRACSLVCRAWTQPAQRLLFRRIPNIFYDNATRLPHIHRLLRALRTSPHLASYVCSVKLFMVFQSDAQKDSPSIALLSLCTNVQSVFLYCGVRLGWVALERHLRAFPVHPVALKIIGESSFVKNIIPLWPALRVLDVHLHDEPNRGVISVPRTVRSLSVSRDCSRAIIWYNHMQLSELTLKPPYWSGHEAWLPPLLLSGVLRQLRSLTIEGGVPPQEFLDQLTQLQSLVVTSLPDREVSLPQSIRHIGYHCTVDGGGGSIRQMGDFPGKVRTLENLQLVTVTPHVPEKVRTALAETCGVRGVEFIVCECGLFPWTRNVDWI